MTPIDWAKRPIQKFADFTGRAPRAEYWWYVLAVVVVSVIAYVIDDILGLKGLIGPYGPLSALLGLGLLCPGIAVATRRLHDTNRSAWWLLLLVPYVISTVMAAQAMASGSMAQIGSVGMLAIIGLIGCIILLVFMVLPGSRGDNRYGPNPYGPEGGPATV